MERGALLLTDEAMAIKLTQPFLGISCGSSFSTMFGAPLSVPASSSSRRFFALCECTVKRTGNTTRDRSRPGGFGRAAVLDNVKQPDRWSNCIWKHCCLKPELASFPNRSTAL